MARPIELTDAVARDIAKSVEGGLPYAHAAEINFVHRMTLYRWVKRGEKEIRRATRTKSDFVESESLFVGFCYAIKRARAAAVQAKIDAINNGEIGWQSAAWWLERIEQGDFGRSVKVIERKKPSEKRRQLPVSSDEMKQRLLLKLNKLKARALLTTSKSNGTTH